MIGRRQLPVSSPLAAGSLAAALWPAVARRTRSVMQTATLVRETFGTPQVALTDSGTSALVLALRIAAGEKGVVAMPAYACVDLAAAARFARVHVRLYDIDPRTLGPDLESLSTVLDQGAKAVVVAHLYGFPADVPAVRALAARHGATVIEDAAQAAGGTLDGRPLGTMGALSILSFGRGKGTTGGHGGALLVHDPIHDVAFSSELAALGKPRRGWNDLLAAAAQYALGRPSVYGIPAAIPGLQLGEMVYHPAHTPRSLSTAAAALVGRALRAGRGEVSVRQRNASVLAIAADEGGDIDAVRTIPGAVSGMLRFPITDTGSRVERPDLGILRGYPRTLRDEPKLKRFLEPGPDIRGAEQLRRTLFTLPTHSRVTRRDMEAMIDWLRVPMRVLAPVLSEAGVPVGGATGAPSWRRGRRT
ncbi:MAG: DegT/DnrJ/EryC1/StrS family aminotransferase [Gemmatimonadaceae bacterium]